jgi:hypothetical protein
MPDDIVTRLQDHPHTLVSDCRCIRCEAANEIERLRPRRLDLRRVSEWPEGQTEQNYDIVSQLRHPWEYDNLNFEVLCDYAADEIERLRAEIIATRAERDAAQTQADHLAKRLVQEARNG